MPGAMGDKLVVINVFTTGSTYNTAMKTTTVFIAGSNIEPLMNTFITSGLSFHYVPPIIETWVKIITTSSHKT